MSEKMIKGYKGFSKGLVCRDKQYAENTVFNCESGMYFCENPLNVLKNYPFYASETKSFSEYAEVEAPEDVTESKGNKSVTKQLKIGSKISFDELIKAGVEFNLSKAKFDKEKSIATGNRSGAMVTGRYSGASATGDYNGAMVTGICSGASATGRRSGASAVGWRSRAMVVGDYSGAMVTGYFSGASATGRRSGAMVVGDDSQAMCKNNSVAVAIGRDSMAKGDIGCYIVLTEVKWDFEADTNKIIDCKCFKVDGEIIKADTFYTLVDGKPVEVE
jgi:hypothetical protein